MSHQEPVNILMVDDQPAKLLSYEAILRESSENLLKARSANEALDTLLRHEIAVVLVDVCMPDLDGYQLAGMIRQHPRYQKTSIIFVSAIMLTDLDRMRGYECGAVDYVPVPVVPEILRAKVGVFCELYRKTRQLERFSQELELRVAERTAALEAMTTALKETDRRKDEFIAVLGHELRNPLAPIRTAVEVLRNKTVPEHDRERARDLVERQVIHMARLVDDLLDVSRITQGSIVLAKEAIDLREVVTTAVDTVRTTLSRLGHVLHLDMPQAPVALFGDATRLAQVLANLLDNAIKFSGRDGRLEVGLSEIGGEAVLRVADSGIGISPELLPRVFDPFTQARGSFDAARSGLGIGLTLVRRLVELHGGRVTAHSDGPGRGSSFVVRLPLQERAATAAPPRASIIPTDEDLAALPRQRVLVVDDNIDAAEALAMLLEVRGHDVRMAHDGRAAVDAAGTFAPHTVLLDLGMREVDGFEAARRIRKEPWGRQMLLVALTGWGQEDDRRRTREAGFDSHLVKPVGEPDLVRVLRTAQAASR